MKIYTKPTILCMAFINRSCILAGSPQLPKEDEEGDDEGSYGNTNGRKPGYNVWDEEDEEEEDY